MSENQSKEIERLSLLLRAREAELAQLREASSRDPRCSCCGYPVAESLRRICITCSEFVNIAEDKSLYLTNFEEAEKTLMCGSCVMDRAEHAGHITLPYLKMKLDQCSKTRASRCLEATMVGSDKECWTDMFCRAGKFFTIIAERIKELETGSKQIGSWCDFENFWNTADAVCNKAQEELYRVKQSVETFLMCMENISQSMERLNKDATKGASEFAPDKVLNNSQFFRSSTSSAGNEIQSLQRLSCSPFTAVRRNAPQARGRKLMRKSTNHSISERVQLSLLETSNSTSEQTISNTEAHVSHAPLLKKPRRDHNTELSLPTSPIEPTASVACVSSNSASAFSPQSQCPLESCNIRTTSSNLAIATSSDASRSSGRVTMKVKRNPFQVLTNVGLPDGTSDQKPTTS